MEPIRHPPTARDKRELFPDHGLGTLALLALVLAAALVLRLLPTPAGLPYLHDWDEPFIASTALHMMQTGSLNPGFFHYGSLAIYAQLGVDVAHYFFLMRQAEASLPVVPLGSGFFDQAEIGLEAIETYFDSGFIWTISHPSFYLWNRVFNAFLGTLTVFWTYLLGRQLGGPAVGLLASAFLAVQGFHVERSALVNPDVPMTLLGLAAVWAAVVYAEEGHPRTLVVSLVFGALAVAVKYNAALCLAAPLAAYLARRFSAYGPRPPAWLGGCLVAVPPLVFLAAMPYAVLDLGSFLRQAGYELHHYASQGHGAVQPEPGWHHVLLQAAEVDQRFGTFAGLLAALGLGFAARRRAGWVAFLFPVLHFLSMAQTRAAFHRNLLPVYPFLAAAAAWGAVALWRRLRPHGGPWRVAALAVVAAVAVHLGAGLVATGERGWTLGRRPETRSVAITRVGELMKDQGDVHVGIAAELRVHRLDLERLDVPFVVAPHLELVCDPSRYDAVVTGVRHLGMWPYLPESKRLAWQLDKAVLDVPFETVPSPPESPDVVRVDGISEDPEVRIYLPRRREIERLPEVCGR